jgi:hypothetical protein
MSTHDPSTPDAGTTRAVALAGLVATLVLAVVGWVWLSRAADGGVSRLARIDTVRAECETLWRGARAFTDTQAVDRVALRDTIDPLSDDALMQCGDLRDKSRDGRAMPNNREMSGEPMPRGLR